MSDINPYFSTLEFQEGLFQLNFNADADTDIELLVTAEGWSFILMKTNNICSADIETHDNKIVVSFVDLETKGPPVPRVNNPYSVTVSVDQTNLIPHFDLERNAIVINTDDIASRTHTLKVYTEDSIEPVAEFKNVRAFRNDKRIVKNHIDRYIRYS